jgi:hypothetical protein
MNNKKLTDSVWLCLRPGEEAATIVSWKVGYNANDTFKSKAPKYFEDDSDLVRKKKTAFFITRYEM